MPADSETLDLIRRLLDEPTKRESELGLDAQTTRVWNDLFLEAADKVRWLCEEIERMRAGAVRITPGEFDRMRAENVQLREDLRHIHTLSTPKSPDQEAS